MANTNSNLLQKLKDTQVSTVTGTVALAGAAICAFSVMPSPDSSFANLLQASLINISSVL
ncbi:hypothetical protein GW756_05865 [bacterium]|nr:hypothetical protein [bacterium]NCQ55946.1 hypothetical protein [Candidatus Parcubacteria bacterium]NCS67971.1 hypothetical protein [Candidatus Peregrinibacteria bacterium]NCS96865.1 hypothetical protein [bacterium]